MVNIACDLLLTSFMLVEATVLQYKKTYSKHLDPVVQRLDNTIHWINHYPVDSVVCFVNTSPLDSDLSGG